MATWYHDMALADDIDALARECAGNWTKFDSFSWYGRHELDDAHNWMILYTHTRDSDCLDESNAHIIAQHLEVEAFEQDVRVEDHNHWACGWIKGYAIRCVGTDGKATLAFQEMVKLATRLNEYPVLDEEDLSNREYRAANETWKNCYNDAQRLQYVRENYKQFYFHSFAEMVGCIKGRLYCGEISEMLGN